MSSLEQNIKMINYLSLVNKEKYKDVRISGNRLIYNSYSIPLDLINIEQILKSNEKLNNEIYTMNVEDIFKIFNINAIMLTNALRTGNYNVYENNNRIVNKLKQTNNVMKNISVINKENSFSVDQYFNIVDSYGNVHTFKNTNQIDISLVIYEYLEKANGKDLDLLIDLLRKRIPELDMVSSINLDNNSKVSEDFKNKLKKVEEEFANKPGVHIYGNEEEEMITIVDTLNPKNNETRTYKKDEKRGMLTEKYSVNEEFEKKSEEEIKKLNENEIEFTNQNDINKNTTIGDMKKEEEIVQLVPYAKFLELINKPTSLNDDEKKQVELWQQTLESIFIYEEYLSDEIVAYYKQYAADIEKMELFGKEYDLNQNQLDSINKFYEISEPMHKEEYLKNVSEERKQNANKVLTRQMNNMDKKGKVSLMVILAIILMACVMVVYIISNMYK